MDSETGSSNARIERPDTGRATLRRELESVPDTDHYALLYESRSEQLDAALSFLQIGLERGERCLYIADENSVAEVRTELEELDVDGRRAIDTDRLQVLSADETYLDGGFDSDRMLRYLLDLVEESAAEGHSGLHVTGEMSWVLDSDVAFCDVLEYEASYQEVTTESDVTALCQYNAIRFDAAAIVDVVQTHPKLIYRGRVCDNPYYTPPEEFLGADRPELEAHRMLETISDLTVAEEKIRDREQRLRVVNRLLRHNLRNDMNVVQGHAEIIERSAQADSVRASADQIAETTEALLEIAEKASLIERTLSEESPSRRRIALRQVVERAAARSADGGAGVDVSVERDVWIEASPEIELAFRELFGVVAGHSDGTPSVSVAVTGSASDARAEHEIALRIEEGDLPAEEIEALVQGTEDPLMHSSGLGLWLIHWIVDWSEGRLQFRCESDSCTELKLFLPAASAP